MSNGEFLEFPTGFRWRVATASVPLQRFPTSVSHLYFWDVVGPGLACGSIVLVRWRVL